MKKSVSIIFCLLSMLTFTAEATPVFNVSAGNSYGGSVTLQAAGVRTSGFVNTGGTISQGIYQFFTNPSNIVFNNGPSPNANAFQNSSWNITGYIDITQVSNTFQLTAVNDFIYVYVDNQLLFSHGLMHSGNFLKNVDLSLGSHDFRIYYINGASSGGFSLKLNGSAITAADAPAPAAPDGVPVIGTLSLLMLGLGMLGTQRRRAA